eukprot:scaffold5296_cov105-Isochrysis_galbana.AAC.11
MAQAQGSMSMSMLARSAAPQGWQVARASQQSRKLANKRTNHDALWRHNFNFTFQFEDIHFHRLHLSFTDSDCTTTIPLVPVLPPPTKC